MKLESTIGKYCPTWARIDAIAGSKQMYSSICSTQCAKFNTENNTCIDMLNKTLFINMMEENRARLFASPTNNYNITVPSYESCCS